MFENSGTTTKENIQQLSSVATPKTIKHFMLFMSSICGVVTIISAFARTYHFWIGLLLAIGLLVEYFMFNKMFAIRTVKIMQENTETGEYQYESSFDDVGVHVHNLSIGTKVHWKYDIIVGLAQMDDICLLFTRGGQYAPIFLNSFTAKQKSDFLAFLKDKCKNLK